MIPTISHTPPEREKHNETRDCTVHAVMHACSISYDEAHALLKAHGRRNRHGFKLWTFLRKREELAGRKLTKLFDAFEVPRHQWETLNRWQHRLQRGRYIVVTRQHAFAMVGGYAHEMGKTGGRSKVRAVYEVGELTAVLPPCDTTAKE